MMRTKMNGRILLVILVTVAVVLAFAAGSLQSSYVEAVPSQWDASFNGELWNLHAVLMNREFVDLTHAFAPGIPRWGGFPDAVFRDLYTYDPDGFWAQEFVHVGQYGTHMDPPAHFHEGLRTVDQIELKEMILPLVVINVADKVAVNNDYQLTVDDILEWEARYGRIPERVFVAMRSDWSKRWPDPVAFDNPDAFGQNHYPGWTVDALRFLFEQRGVTAIGHETKDTDAAVAQPVTGFAAESYVLSTNHYQIELLANLDKVPEAGALVFVVVPKPLNGSGFPARVFAILPFTIPPPTPSGVCPQTADRIPPAVQDDAMANPERYGGWGLPRNPNLPPSRANPWRTWLSLRNAGLPYSPMGNPPVWKAGCP